MSSWGLAFAMLLMAFNPKGPTTLQAARELAHAETREALAKFGKWLCGSEQGGEDLIQEAFLIVGDPDHRLGWDGQRPFGKHMRLVMTEVRRNERRRAQSRREKLDAEGDPARAVAAVGEGADDDLAERRELARLQEMGAALRPRLKGRALRVFDWLCEDDELGNIELAAREGDGCTAQDIHNAKRQILDRALAVRDGNDRARVEELKERREAARGHEP
jgi:DNA-directed RNA polymerase specialized sigma24 family protein